MILNILYVGGKNWNGDLDFLRKKGWNIDVLDIIDGENVDIIPEDPYKWTEIADDTYDLTISTNTFQHIDYFWLTILEMKRVTKSGGLIYIIAPSVRYDGKYPYANWAFNDHGLAAIANWADLEIVDHSVAGVPSINTDKEWDTPLDDAVLIARKTSGRLLHLPDAHLKISRRYIKM